MNADMNVGYAMRRLALAGVGAAVLALAGCAEMNTMMHRGHHVNVSLTGAEEVPPVSTSAQGSGTINIADDKSVSGSVTTSGVAGVAAHIHTGARGQNGPISIGMVKTADNVWSIPAGAKLNDAQYAAFRAGNLYVNVHSAQHKGGEIRGQLNP
jgi:hypothetical protein